MNARQKIIATDYAVLDQLIRTWALKVIKSQKYEDELHITSEYFVKSKGSAFGNMANTKGFRQKRRRLYKEVTDDQGKVHKVYDRSMDDHGFVSARGSSYIRGGSSSAPQASKMAVVTIMSAREMHFDRLITGSRARNQSALDYSWNTAQLVYYYTRDEQGLPGASIYCIATALGTTQDRVKKLIAWARGLANDAWHGSVVD